MGNGLARIIGIARHRLPTDGDGVTTVVALHCWALGCCLCLNARSLSVGIYFG